MVKDITLRVFVALQSALSATKDEEGQTLAEYGLIMALIAVSVVVLAVVAFRTAIIAAFDSAKTCLSGSC